MYANVTKPSIILRLIRFFFTWESPTLTAILVILAGLPFIILTFLSPVLLNPIPLELVLGDLADARALKAGTLSLMETENPIALIFIAVADMFGGEPGRVMIIARAILALLILTGFTIFTKSRLPVLIAAFLSALITVNILNPYVSLHNIPFILACLLSFGFLVPPQINLQAPKPSYAFIGESIIGAVLLIGLFLSGIVMQVVAFLVLTLSAFMGGQRRGIRYFASLVFVFVILAVISILKPEVINIFVNTPYETRIINIPDGNLMMLSGGNVIIALSFLASVLLFGAKANVYTLLYNRPAKSGILLGACAAISVFFLLGVQVENSFNKLYAQYLIEDKVDNIQFAMIDLSHEYDQNHATLGTSFLDIFLTRMKMLERFHTNKISIITNTDIACILTNPNNEKPKEHPSDRSCYADGLRAVKFSDIVIVPRFKINLETDRLIERSEGILYSEFKHIESDDMWDIWQRKKN